MNASMPETPCPDTNTCNTPLWKKQIVRKMKHQISKDLFARNSFPLCQIRKRQTQVIIVLTVIIGSLNCSHRNYWDP